jgi:hypothetical protein|tara:strand:+ start:519 stop:1139 length:621 start_codon:yes stop_codon:yes gene_type:complete
MKFTNIFKDQFYQALRTPAGNNPVRDRSDSFLKVFELLEEKNKDFYTIVETGCMRADHGQLAMGDDGASTYLLDKFVNHYDGQVFSVDINENNCNHARSFVSEKTTVVCEDSVRFLWNLALDKPIDFLYLDSYDIDRNNPHPSQLHHVKELCAIISRLGSGTIVVIDDHDAFFTGGQVGKGTYVKDFMDNIGATLLFEDYQIGWVL